MNIFWKACTAQLADELTPEQFANWIAPLYPLSYSEGYLAIAAPNPFNAELARFKFSDRIEELANEYWNDVRGIQFVVENRNNDEYNFQLPAFKRSLENAFGKANDTLTLQQRNRCRINPALTFDNFVPGIVNQQAYALAKKFLENLRGAGAPLFLAGAEGTGKTHLSHAIGNQFLNEHPQAKVRYVTSDQFIREVVSAYQGKTFSEFRDFYHSLDLLILDDLQFFVEKLRTQEEFCKVLNALMSANKQIVVACNSPLSQLVGLDPRLASQLESSLKATIKSPDLESRTEVFLTKAQNEGLSVAAEVAQFVALQCTSMRGIEGALRTILAFVRLREKQLTIEDVKVALN